jgi:hypothetical protein
LIDGIKKIFGGPEQSIIGTPRQTSDTWAGISSEPSEAQRENSTEAVVTFRSRLKSLAAVRRAIRFRVCCESFNECSFNQRQGLQLPGCEIHGGRC